LSAITTHVLDTSLGRPGHGIAVTLERRGPDGDWSLVGRGLTDSDGRARDLVSSDSRVEAGIYRLTFDTRSYFDSLLITGFYPEVRIVFEIADPAEHHHVPLLLSPYGYSTYRGS
jgi:5-hydroxyisourate hydrolase